MACAMRAARSRYARSKDAADAHRTSMLVAARTPGGRPLSACRTLSWRRMTAVALVSAATIAAESGWAGPDVFTSVVGSILGGPTSAVRGTDGRYHVVYELQLTNTRSVLATLQAVEVLAGAHGPTLLLLAGPKLLGGRRRLDARPATNLELPSSESRLVLISLDFSSARAVRKVLHHRLEAQAALSPAAQVASPVSYRLAPFTLDQRASPTFRPPLTGAGWLVVNRCCGEPGAHRRAIL